MCVLDGSDAKIAKFGPSDIFLLFFILFSVVTYSTEEITQQLTGQPSLNEHKYKI